MSYDPRAIANYFLDLAKAQGKSLSPLKVQKLVYYAHGWHLALKGSPLLNESVEAWAYGPVIPSIYQSFRMFGNQPITSPALRQEFISGPDGYDIEETEPNIDDLPDESKFCKALLNRIWEIYGNFSATQLSNMTHEAGSPWHRVYEQYHGDIPAHTDIPEVWIKEYFQNRLRAGSVSQ